MLIQYNKFSITLKLNNSISFSTNPLFLLRSVLGYQLHSMCCLQKNTNCQSCMYNGNCAYAFIFETILNKTNETLPGRIRGSHPFLLQSNQNISNKTPISEFTFSIILLGKAVEYFPYIFGAFERAGKAGLLKQRTPFLIENLTSLIKTEDNIIKKNQLYIEDNEIKNLSTNCLDYESTNNIELTKSGEILVQLLSPLRFKVAGKYTSEFNSRDFMMCLFRRQKTLCSLYGSCEDAAFYPADKIQFEITEKNLTWTDSNHYSARQKNSMELGGLTGTFKLKGTFTQQELDLIHFAKLFNAGKNTNFGLGQIDYWEKLD